MFLCNEGLRITCIHLLESYYQPSTAGKYKVDPPLAANGSLSVGYGSGGSAPFTYLLRQGQDVDVGFLKLFLTTEYVDFSNMPQASPFSQDHRGVARVHLKKMSTWGAVLVTMVQRSGKVAKNV